MEVFGQKVNPKTAAFFGIFYVLAFVTYWLKPFGIFNTLAENTVYLIAPLLAVASAIYLVTRYGLTNKKSAMFMALCTGLVFLFVGESIFVYFDFIVKQRPFPSVADAYYLLSYPFIFLSMFIESTFMRVSLKNTNLKSGAIFLTIFLILAVIESYFGIYKAYLPDDPLLNNIISIAYGVGDFLIISGAMYLLFLARNLRRNAESYFWTGLIAGFGSITAADILFAEFSDIYLSGNVMAKNVMDSFWMLGYVTIAFFLTVFAQGIAHSQLQLGVVGDHQRP